MEAEAPLYELLVSDDQMSLLLNCELNIELFDATIGGIMQELKQIKVTPQPTEEKVKSLFQDALFNGTALKHVRVVAGIDPGESVDARVEWDGDFFNTQFAVDEATGRIDYRRRLGEPNVEPGRLLGRLYPHSEGEPGQNIFGKRVPARKPTKLKLTAGRNVESELDGQGVRTFKAKAAGRVRLQGEVLLVDDVLEIKGDVGLESGDLEHPGAIIVHGDVLAGSTIRAGGDIEVKGLVEAASIETRGGLAVRMGIHGGGEARIRLGGNLQSHFISEAEVICEGDVIVESEVTQASIICTGALKIPAGRIVGGAIHAFGGVKAGQIGSPSHTRTYVEAAHDLEIEPRLAPIREAVSLLESRRERIMKSVQPFTARRDLLPREQLATLIKLEQTAEEISRVIREKKDYIASIREESAARLVPEIVVNRMLYPESLLQIGEVFRAVNERMEGPMLVKPHQRESLAFVSQGNAA